MWECLRKPPGGCFVWCIPKSVKSQQMNYKVRLENLTPLAVLDIVSYSLNRTSFKFWRNAPCSRSHLSKTQYHKFSWNWNLDCSNSESFISQKRRDTFRSRNAQIITLFEIKFFLVVSILSVESSSPQSHRSLLCSFRRLRDCFILFFCCPSLPSPLLFCPNA